jgi:hypothetical protein
MIADSQAHAREMDAADGKIDGKFFGDKVVVDRRLQKSDGSMDERFEPKVVVDRKLPGLPTDHGLHHGLTVSNGHHVGQEVTSFSVHHEQPDGRMLASSVTQARALDAADGVMDGQYHGSTIGVRHSSSHRMMADSQAHAREMDAADGKIDGKFFGDKVVVDRHLGGSGAGGRMMASSVEQARALDAADGKIDGYYHGNKVGVHHRLGPKSHSMIADSLAHAREMDAADGKIDGKCFGEKVIIDRRLGGPQLPYSGPWGSPIVSA